MHYLSANELKTNGIKAIEQHLLDAEEVFITVRGKSRYVVLPIESYDHIRELELQQALQESIQDIKEGRFHKGNIKSHIKRISE